MYQILEHGPRGIGLRVVFETSNRTVCARFYCLLIGRETLDVHTAAGKFEPRPAVHVVAHAIDPRRALSLARFTADGPKGRRYVARFIAPAKAPVPRPRPHTLPPGFYDLTRLTARDAISVEPGRKHS